MKKESYVFFATLAMDTSSRMVSLCTPLLALRFGASYGDLGLIGAAGALAYITGCLTYRKLADRIGYQRCMAVSTGLVAAITLLYPWASRVAHIAALSVATALLASGYWPVVQAWLGHGRSRRDLLLALSHFNLAIALCSILGPVAGGALYGAGFTLPFWVAACGIGALSLSMFALRFEEISLAAPAASPASAPDARSFLHIAWVANFATYFAVSNLRSLFPKFATDIGVSPGTLGLLMALMGLTQFVTFYLIARTDRWQFRLIPIAALQGLGVAGLAMFVVGESSGAFAAGFLAMGALAGVTFAASSFYSLCAGGAGSRRAGLHEAVVGSGFLLGPLTGGLAAERLGPRAPYLLCAGVMLCALGLQTYLYRKIRRTARGAGKQAAECGGAP
ncbi:MAG: MFS transporter [Candidatus Latescibacteria bacterium]|nr:MFS transporter [Candidatus Latescibacterota bacterium]